MIDHEVTFVGFFTLCEVRVYLEAIFAQLNKHSEGSHEESG
jgi:hypothetical protein